ncbi:MAG: PfkB family carbohydrate kinase [Defluviitaleaceae bacterium]|nr:PfkB family carbohydrate kinase [Defluviitaleaceae bacterium]
MKKILALSCCCVDYFPEKDVINAGGNALNVAASCVKTGKVQAFLMGNIGTDKFAEEVKKKADELKINHEKLYKADGETANNKIYLTEGGDRYFKEDSWTNGVLRDFKISSDDRAFIKTFDAVATTLNDGLVAELCEISHESNFLLSVDFLEHIPTDDWLGFFHDIDIFFISGKQENLPLYKKWSADYPALFVATLAENGSIAFKNGEEFICEAEKVDNVVDTTGCGDSYQGAFIVDYLINSDVLSAMKAGSKAAAVTLSFIGAI